MTSHSQRTVVTRDDASDSSMAPPRALTGAQRQRAYRLRRKRAVIDAIGEEVLASRVTLLALLSDGLAALEASCTSTMLIEIKRESVRRVLKAIVTRYDIDLTD
ncbi:hypothetical protein WK57_11325 [Burkholderia ubonensis]|uniref:Uncharacterized protein n=3 Tax=Burkholderia ubonensis TaxID=101571 RepID=A0AA40R8E6_9BURK|nr:hypothetical protein [Burkholderia ubonensis]KWZ52149.1 hypothetical protein WK57_23780 [Burkholderia ubonensis]KWZ57647.1 hypothetical protein WK57_19335 [Burkholderia ubonensis]KWZ57893.1 hypothetical protein WK57_20795 [Burkholderia ubonensis]KWZ58317.1 hypothetical protein WK57_17470 [Burkholderia ubonensis]KWZ58396.1 hypothetical protein WK57_18055 [Burkholderia ubonensis]